MLSNVCHSRVPEVSAIWAWHNHLEARAAAAGRAPLLVNLDETSVPLVFTHRRGYMRQKKSIQIFIFVPVLPLCSFEVQFV